MKYIRHIFESEVDDNISKIYDAAYEMMDEVDEFNAQLHGGWLDLYTVNFNYEIKSHDPMNIYENQNEMQEIYKECDVFFKRLNDLGFEITYFLLETKQHKNYSRVDGKLQIKVTQ